jgi:hypothetical protein
MTLLAALRRSLRRVVPQGGRKHRDVRRAR